MNEGQTGSVYQPGVTLFNFSMKEVHENLVLISCGEQQHHSSLLSARPLGQAYLSWPAGPGCGVYEAWCLWACWWCTCLPSQLSHVGASLLANRSPHQLADLQLTNKVVGTRGLNRGKKKKKEKKRQDSWLQRDRKKGIDGGKVSMMSTCFAALVYLHVGHCDGQAVVRSTGWSGGRGVTAQSVGDHTSGSWEKEEKNEWKVVVILLVSYRSSSCSVPETRSEDSWASQMSSEMREAFLDMPKLKLHIKEHEELKEVLYNLALGPTN